jgi:hypothetical protein
MRRNGGTRQAHGSGKLYRKETKFPNSWMNMRKYATNSMRIFLDTITTMVGILSTGALRYPTKVYTLFRLFIVIRDKVWSQGVSRRTTSTQTVTDLSKAITQELQSTVTAGNTTGQAAPTEDLASCDIHNAQALAPDIQAANGEEKATCFRRSTDSMESINDSAPAAGSSPWRPVSVPFNFLDYNTYNMTGRWFRQITPLGIRNTRSLGTSDILEDLRPSKISGVLGSMPQTVP